MSGLESIRSINENNALMKRARAYATNHPRVSVSEALIILAGEDAGKRRKKEKVQRVAKSHAKARRCCP